MLKSKMFKYRYNLSVHYRYRLKKKALNYSLFSLKKNRKSFFLFLLRSRFNKSSSLSFQNSRCFFSNRSRSIYKNFGLSRIMLRQKFSKAVVSGVQKNSW